MIGWPTALYKGTMQDCRKQIVLWVTLRASLDRHMVADRHSTAIPRGLQVRRRPLFEDARRRRHPAITAPPSINAPDADADQAG
jgi:hypothetical protein